MKLLETKNLEFAYEDNVILKDISLSIEKGEKIAVVGANGVGKSTFFLALNGINRVREGMLFFKEKPVTYSKKNLVELRKGVGIVFQDPDNQIVAQTVFHEIAFGGMNLGYTKEEVIDKTESIMEQLSLTPMAQRAPHYLSGGEKKRVTIGDLLIMEPEIMLLDEPTASLDAIHVEQLKDILENLHERGMTLMISTHDIDFVYEWADRVLVFHDKTVIGDGTCEEIFSNDLLLEQAQIKKPVLYELYEAIAVRNKVQSGNAPKSVDELIALL